MKILAAIYNHPEAYPPTLNAINELSKIAKKIYVIYRNNLEGSWSYPSNVKEIKTGKLLSVQKQMALHTILKVYLFLQFSLNMLFQYMRLRPSIILIYDPLPLLSLFILKPFIKKNIKIWYHNHDVAEIDKVKKFSLGYFAIKAEHYFFKRLDIFSLPSEERIPYFKTSKFKGKLFIIPNYPSKQFYSQFYENNKSFREIKIIYQGSIGEGHGIEFFVPVLNKKINQSKLVLVLKGNIKDTFKQKLNKLITRYDVAENVQFHQFSPYEEVPKLAATCHIGIAIFLKKDLMNRTLGTASNKIYEYAAVGLPIIYSKESAFSEILEPFNWAFQSDLNPENLHKTVENIINNYQSYSKSAFETFSNKLNFEKYFTPVLNYLNAEN